MTLSLQLKSEACNITKGERKPENTRLWQLALDAEKLEAENQRYRDRLSQLETEIKALREASTKVLLALLPGKIVHMGHEHVRYSATYSIVGWNPILSLAALLGGGENG